MQSSGDGESAQSEVGVQPGAKRNALEAVEGQALKAYVTAPPEGGKANDALVALLAKALGVAKGSVRVVRGHRGSRPITTCWIKIMRNMATIGDKSSMPKRGSILRRGAKMGSVIWYTTLTMGKNGLDGPMFSQELTTRPISAT